MTREEHLRFCKICKKRKFNPNKGIICSLSNEIADFEDECSSFEEDAKIKIKAITQNETHLDNSNRASIAIKIFWCICIANLLAVISGFYEFELLERIRLGEHFTDEEATMNDLSQGVIGLIQSALYIASIITFLNWFRRAYGNLHRIGVGLEHNESMAVWSFFIPFVSLYRPYKIAKEILVETRKKISKFDEKNSASRSFPILGLWWALFLITNWIGQFAFKSFMKDETLEQMITSTQAYMFSDFVDIPAAFVTILLIKQIASDERKLFNMSERKKTLSY